MDLMIVRRHMAVGGIVTAKGYTAGLAGSQVHPGAVNFDAFCTNKLFGRLDFSDRAQMLAYLAVFTHILKLRDSGDLFVRQIFWNSRNLFSLIVLHEKKRIYKTFFRYDGRYSPDTPGRFRTRRSIDQLGRKHNLWHYQPHAR